MRCTHCLNYILTGSPGFERALEALPRQVDDQVNLSTLIHDLQRLSDTREYQLQGAFVAYWGELHLEIMTFLDYPNRTRS